MRWTLARLAAFTVAVCVTLEASSQTPVAVPGPPSAPSGGGSVRFGGGGGPPDPDAIWNMMTKGENVDTIDLNKRPDLKQRMQKMGSPIPADGIIRKDKWKADFQQKMATGFGRGSRGSREGSPRPAPAPVQAVVVASPPPMPGPVPAQPVVNPAAGKADKNAADDKPVVTRYGNLPKGLPSWFETYDDDKDGAIGLYEWRRNKEPIAKFVEMDLNGDGILTAEEWLRHQTMSIAKMPDGTATTAATARTGGGRFSVASTKKPSDKVENQAEVKVDGKPATPPTDASKPAAVPERRARGQRASTDATAASGVKRNPFIGN